MIRLSKISTRAPENLTKQKAKIQLKAITKEIGELLMKVYAEEKQSLLIVLQGMDSSGKDGTVKNVFRYASPVNINVKSFKKPTDEEFAHDFLWRCHKLAPAKGFCQIFVRSHYEDILIQRVHKWITPSQVKMRMNAINAWEELLKKDNNTTILKFYLHLSKERQLEKLKERIAVPEKNWKHKDGDWSERRKWNDYMTAYEYAINQSKIPWIIAPVDQRWYRNLFIAKEVLKALRKMKPVLPGLESEKFSVPKSK